MVKVLLIDNYDSFTWNIYQYFSKIGAEVKVVRNDVCSLLDIEQFSPHKLVISPGPGTPGDAGISLSVISYFANKLPILGICLGHQVIAQFFGAKIVRSKQAMHGKQSVIYHDCKGIFANLSQFLKVVRYNSLVVDIYSLPSCLEVSAWSVLNDGKYDEIMAIRHRNLRLEGIQFHPESILSEQGYEMLVNFIHC
ncbi:aminodeoxychorismate/anthranilate synthase component II [Blochmannia endosymbiont of Colobopsis nipponica]|uniref:anthranilate synthase component II n=1 Tax=Blochmannia endosymbiont of Colobopsis nipponica TaxID=2681987 RepID=UPI0017874A94|nr:aminodeoxychorismate/anthranilate synthase component II [Blochmannia endosymbiont of Colobopsis nipponica]QOI11342.1 aminodeoxychorismate/anthranilate synthase component II [Blochmannia endosymbiont of Colobopsis nipponica]